MHLWLYIGHTKDCDKGCNIETIAYADYTISLTGRPRLGERTLRLPECSASVAGVTLDVTPRPAPPRAAPGRAWTGVIGGKPRGPHSDRRAGDQL